MNRFPQQIVNRAGFELFHMPFPFPDVSVRFTSSEIFPANFALPAAKYAGGFCISI